MAEVVLRKKVEETSREDVEVCSRGLVVLFEEPVHTRAADIVRQHGYKIYNFLSAQLEQEEITEDTLIITMTEDQKNKVLENYEGFLDVVTIYEYAGEFGDIKDPYGKNQDEYECCFLQIQQLVDKIWKTQINLQEEEL